jgi:hypothetical protein
MLLLLLLMVGCFMLYLVRVDVTDGHVQLAA